MSKTDIATMRTITRFAPGTAATAAGGPGSPSNMTIAKSANAKTALTRLKSTNVPASPSRKEADAGSQIGFETNTVTVKTTTRAATGTVVTAASPIPQAKNSATRTTNYVSAVIVRTRNCRNVQTHSAKIKKAANKSRTKAMVSAITGIITACVHGMVEIAAARIKTTTIVGRSASVTIHARSAVDSAGVSNGSGTAFAIRETTTAGAAGMEAIAAAPITRVLHNTRTANWIVTAKILPTVCGLRNEVLSAMENAANILGPRETRFATISTTIVGVIGTAETVAGINQGLIDSGKKGARNASVKTLSVSTMISKRENQTF